MFWECDNGMDNDCAYILYTYYYWVGWTPKNYLVLSVYQDVSFGFVGAGPFSNFPLTISLLPLGGAVNEGF